jgi:PAS domain S-box-containing protein
MMSAEPEIVRELREAEKGRILGEKTTGEDFQTNITNDDMEKQFSRVISLKSNLLNSLLKNSPDSIYFKDKEGRYIEISDAKLRHLNMEKNDIIGKTDFDFYLQEEAKKMREDEIYVMENKESICREEKITRQNGEMSWISVVKTPWFDSDGNIVGTLGISRDITDKKTAEIILKESEERLKDLFDNANDLIQSVDPQGYFRFVNKKWKKTLGYSEEESKKLHFTDIISKDYLPHCKKIFNELSQGESFDNVEVVFVSKNKDEITIEGNITPIIKNGEFSGTRGIFRDITERKKAEKELQESEERYRTIFENSAVGIMMTDYKENIISWNNFTEKLLGMNKNDLHMKPVRELYPSEEWEKIRKENIREKGMQHHLETKMYKKDGNTVDVDVSVSVLKDNAGKIIGSIGVFRDITKRKEMEEKIKEVNNLLQIVNKNLEKKVEERTSEIKKLLKQKDEFIYQLGHDLKTPLVPLNSLLPVIKNKVDDEQIKKYLDLSIQNVTYMKNIIQKTLKLALLNSNSFELEIENTNAYQVIDRVIQNRNNINKGNNIEIENLVKNNIEISVDKLRFEELIDNLISNSVKYSQENGKIIINAQEEEDKIKFSIKDTGQGMTEGQIEKIFDEFYKVDKSRHDFNSSGLGLSICKKIVEKHGGKIWAESDGVGKGSTFYFTLDIAKSK